MFNDMGSEAGDRRLRVVLRGLQSCGREDGALKEVGRVHSLGAIEMLKGKGGCKALPEVKSSQSKSGPTPGLRRAPGNTGLTPVQRQQSSFIEQSRKYFRLPGGELLN